MAESANKAYTSAWRRFRRLRIVVCHRHRILRRPDALTRLARADIVGNFLSSIMGRGHHAPH